MDQSEISLILRVEGGTADEGLLDVHDAAGMMNGLARAVNLVAHAFANENEVRTKNQSAHGAKALVHSSRKGCFEEQVDIRFEKRVTDSFGHSVISDIFWDYLTWTWSHSVGVPYEPETPKVKKIATKNDLFIYEIADALEAPMHLVHKAIVKGEEMTVFLNRPRVGDKLVLTQETLDFVSTREEQTATEYIVGNVTRVNTLSHFGRLFSDEEDKVVSFALANPDDSRVKGLALQSMQDSNEGMDGKVNLKVSKILSAQGIVKRYVVHDILEILV